ncbi:MAG: hypothetical protein WA885_05850, partial [Phormidesmis sp.]
TPVADAVVACHGFCGVLLLSTTLPIYHCPPQLPIDPFMQQSRLNGEFVCMYWIDSKTKMAQPTAQLVGRTLGGSLRRVLISAAVVSAISVACVPSGLQDYTQVTLKAIALETETEINLDQLDQTKDILQNRLMALGVEAAEVETVEDRQIVVRLPQTVDVEAAETILTSVGLLSFRNQKPDTEAKLASNIEDLQRLLVEQNTLFQAEEQAKAEALGPKIEETRGAIAALFEPGELTGAMLSEAEAMPAKAGSAWEVTIALNEEGTALFTAQTKAMAGTGRAIGIFLDDVLLSAPLVDVAFAKTGISGGEAVISGNFTEEAAENLEIQLKSGALPVTLEIVEVVSSGSEASDTPEEEVPEAGSVSEPKQAED